MVQGKPKTVSEEIKEVLDKAWTKTKLISLLKTTAPTFYKKLDNNDWSDEQLEILRANKVIGRVGRSTR